MDKSVDINTKHGSQWTIVRHRPFFFHCLCYIVFKGRTICSVAMTHLRIVRQSYIRS